MNIVDYDILRSTVIVFCACPAGWGVTYNEHSAGGHCSVEKYKNQISISEMEGALSALKIYCKCSVSLYFKIDDTFVIISLNKQTTPNKKILN